MGFDYQSHLIDSKTRHIDIYLSGWGVDCRAFSVLLDIQFPSIFCNTVSPATMAADIVAFMKTSSFKIRRIIGFSMGGYVACELARFFPDATLYLLGMRPSYPADEIAQIHTAIMQDGVRPVLTNFIQRCFTKSQWSVFESALGNIYLDAFSEDILLDGLTYLLGSGRLSTVDPKWFFIHGQRDTIAPFSELYSFLETHEALGQLTSCPRFRHWPELAVLTGV